MAVERNTVDLRALASGCSIPYSTLARWAVLRKWEVEGYDGLRRLYDFDVVWPAVLVEVAARQDRERAA